ncbi:hypothetical protein BC833DRAFT_600452 [Globomyces pollinis-pini]|nr:hypothetical protein BC833DRAFT_600452 [Globomyces pollinis-pini]
MSISKSFLLEMCDFHLNYSGCENKSKFAFIDGILIILHGVSLLFYGYYLIRRLLDKKRGGFKDMDLVAALAVLYTISRIIFLAYVRLIVNFDINTIRNEQIQLHVAGIVYIEMIVWIFGGLTTNALVQAMVTASSGAKLYSPMKINGKIVDPARALKLYRVVVLLVNSLSFCLLASKGVYGTKEDYIMYRRFPYLWLSILCFFVSPYQLYFFGGLVIKAFKNTLTTTTAEAPDTYKTQHTQRTKNTQTPDTRNTKDDENNDIKVHEFLRFLQLNIYSVIVFLYWPSAFYLTFYWVLNETITDQSILFNVKVATDILLWINTTFFAGFLIYKLPPLFIKK